MTIQSLTKFREDGKIVPSTMNSIEMLELGWGPSMVKRVSWIADGIEFNYHSAYALSACIVDGLEYIAIVESTDDLQKSSLLRIISGNGTSQITASNKQQISGRYISGQFEWFNRSVSAIPHILGIIFRPAEGSDAYSMRIDAATGLAISAEYIRA